VRKIENGGGGETLGVGNEIYIGRDGVAHCGPITCLVYLALAWAYLGSLAAWADACYISRRRGNSGYGLFQEEPRVDSSGLGLVSPYN
jgi:hypothetical protein